MDIFVLLPCPGCTFRESSFFLLSMFVGTVPVTYYLLRPYTRTVQTWGIPRIDTARLLSLCLILATLIPCWHIGRQEYPPGYVAACICGLVAWCVYLWFRCCWLLDSLHITSASKELLFPGLLLPGILMLGTTVGSWVLGILLVAPMWPMILLPLKLFSAAVGVPTAMLVVSGLN